MIKYLHDWFRYFSDYSCPRKRAFWFGLIGIDFPLLGFDYGFFVYYADILDFMVAFFRGDMGKVIQYTVGVLACILTWERIKQARLVKEQIRRSLEDTKE